MSPPGDDARRFAAMLADNADHSSVTADRLAGTTDGVADLESALVTHLADGERPRFCFEAAREGVGLGDPDDTVDPERGGAFLFTDLRVYLQLGVGETGDKSLSLPYGDIDGVGHRDGPKRHRIDLSVADTAYYLWIPGRFDADDVARAAEYATYRRKAETPDTGGGDVSRTESQTVEERLRRLGDAHSRGLISTEEFERRKQNLKEYDE
ncbi:MULTISPECIES: SHOCT domain-containing protein [Halorussus]|uniref:SHOCT domain-containing protein n=1 Tax=Halorussus TaxID=1070314 RepID=UPI000E21968D|nr:MULTISPECIES: SHOCT domain-containing protein [Halorussus]NHN58264.1 SHOCT domain-containing protein [Halorussus sp. JP-T4]